MSRITTERAVADVDSAGGDVVNAATIVAGISAESTSGDVDSAGIDVLNTTAVATCCIAIGNSKARQAHRAGTCDVEDTKNAAGTYREFVGAWPADVDAVAYIRQRLAQVDRPDSVAVARISRGDAEEDAITARVGVRLLNGGPECAHTVADSRFALAVTGEGIISAGNGIERGVNNDYHWKCRLLRDVNAGCGPECECGCE